MADMIVPQPRWRLTYEQRDVTIELAPVVLAVTYTDVLSGESDELEITLEDRDGRWKNEWFPGKGDSLGLDIGYAGKSLVHVGSFEIDEIEFSGVPDTISIRALAAGVKSALRTANSAGHEGRTLRQIAESIAAKHGLALVGAGDNGGRIYDRVTQHDETDLAFLNRLGSADGVVFSIKDGKLVWHDQDKLDGAGTVFVITRTDAMQFSFRAKTATTYRACRVSYHDPKSKSLKTHTETADGAPSGDTLKLVERCESLEQAQAKARAALRGSNGRQVEGGITLSGNERLRAGCNIELAGFGLLDGPYQIATARHTMDRSGGYTTELELSTASGQHKNLQNRRNAERRDAA